MAAETTERPDDDEARLHALGYAQELRRSMSGFANFAVSFTIISILSGCLTLYGFGLATGGPAAMIWGWPLVGVFVVLVGLGMAEVCSSYPTAGGLYYWAAKLARRNGAAWSWFTGWFNLIGQVAVTAGIDFGAALFLNAFLNLQFGMAATPGNTIMLLGAILVLHGLLNTFGVRLVALLNSISVWWHLIGVALIVTVLAVVPDKHQDASFVFGEFVNNTGWGSSVYVFALGLLLAQYTLTGYDASAHMTEETRNAAIAGPRGIVRSIVVSLVAGWILLLGLTFAIQDYDGTVGSETGVPPAQIFIDATGATTGKLLLLICIGAQLFCGMASVTANSRMIYAFARDGALPGSSFWHRINKRTRTPTNSVWLAAGGAFLLALPYLWSSTAYAAVTSIAVVGLYVAYVIPVFLRVRRGDEFERGPWHLGRWGRPVGIVATVWVALIFVLFMLPQKSPVTVDTFNYTPIAFLIVLGGAGLWWVVSARKWFTGPKVQGTEEELAAVERDLKA
ncbi:amino acid/polyamine/organocation transporter (APC superfamily) [Herbihabitans rhizosphaerae]|uniref:Amino acid/polyamine/organocation transporter (APC superfamily) n=1 Tax=Herbihabitans rhizosphaerae TaxID=1872711 RepID=A0A4Q7KJ17_9PSEU|nr:amino acid permease [Herbihabitans rhizosphaerae]RZS34940.1 amino acid/polyamine/organocation transporter (APC superfamily) [Herbihabitans rhizosphaerae]